MKRTADEVLALLAEHGGHFFALLFRLTLRNDVAEDLMQELFCKLSRSDQFRAARDPYAYAFRAATNLAFGYRRRQRRLPLSHVADGDVQVADPAGRDQSPLADLVRREELSRVLDAIGRLPRTARDIVVLRYLERESFETIGDRLGKTPHQVRALCHKGIVRLRRMLGETPTRPDRKAETS